MEKPPRPFDVCIVCALPEEARAFLEVLQQQCEGVLEEHVSPRYQFSYCSATLRNQKDESLGLHVSWLPRYGPQEMTLHLSHVLEECQPRIAIMTGICAGDSQQVQLGDLVVAERTFTYDNGKFTLDEHGRSVHLYDTMTYQLDANILQFLGLFDDWRPLVARLKRPPSSPELPKRRKIVCHIKAMASGSAVRIDNPFEDIQAPVRGAVAIDMEGAAFGLVMSHHPLIRWLVVKGICDHADQTKNDAYHDYAAHASALYALSFIRAYVTEQRMPNNRQAVPKEGDLHDEMDPPPQPQREEQKSYIGSFQHMKIFVQQQEEFDLALSKSMPGKGNSKAYIQAKNKKVIDRVLSSLADACEACNLWWFAGYQHNPACPIKRLTEEVWLIQYNECKIIDLWVYRHATFERQYVLLHLAPQLPFGLYNSDDANIDWEAAGYYKERYVTKGEYDDGYAEIDGEVIELHGVELRWRNLKDDFIVLVPYYSVYNRHENDQQTVEVYQALCAAGKIDQSLLQPLEQLERPDWMELWD